MYMHPESYIALQDQDRERALAQRALQRAAHEGGEQHPGIARGGINAFAKFVRNAAGVVIHARSAGPRPTTRPTGV